MPLLNRLTHWIEPRQVARATRATLVTLVRGARRARGAGALVAAFLWAAACGPAVVWAQKPVVPNSSATAPTAKPEAKAGVKPAAKLAATAATAATAAAPASSAASGAASAANQVTEPTVEGKTIDGTPFNLASLKGKVVMLMFWSTECAVCRDKMPELRQNYQGWMGKPFALVAINTDRKVQDFLDYERIVTTTVPQKQRFIQLWTGEASYADNIGKHKQLPATFLLDKTGKVVARYVGRIPADAWDAISDWL